MTDLAWTEPAPAVSGLDTTGETPIPWSAKASKDTETPSLVTRYFTEASRHPVLGERAERKLGRQLARALASLRIALGHPDNTALTLRDVIGNRREEELDSRRLRRCFRIAEACRQRLIQSNLRLAVHIARRHNGRHLPLTDLIQEANIGLIKAVERFDPERGFRFTTYAYWWVSEEVKRSLKRGPGVVRTPENMVDDLRALNAVQQRLSSELGRAPEANALAAALGWSAQHVRQLQRRSLGEISTDTPLPDSDDLVVGDRLAGDEMMQPDALLEPRDQRRIVSDILSHLTVREQDVLSRRFGLNRPEPETLQIISDQLGLSRERIRQIEKRALERLRQAYTNLGDLTGN